MRIDGRGLVNRAAPLGFTFDGASYLGCEGDTLASAPASGAGRSSATASPR